MGTGATSPPCPSASSPPPSVSPGASGMFPESRYSAARSALWKLRFSANITCSREHPRAISSVMELSSAEPVRSAEAADSVVFTDAVDPVVVVSEEAVADTPVDDSVEVADAVDVSTDIGSAGAAAGAGVAAAVEVDEDEEDSDSLGLSAGLAFCLTTITTTKFLTSILHSEIVLSSSNIFPE